MNQILVHVKEQFTSFAQLLDQMAVLLVLGVGNGALFELCDLDLASFVWLGSHDRTHRLLFVVQAG